MRFIVVVAGAALLAGAGEVRADGIRAMPCDESVRDALVSFTDVDTLEVSAAGGERFYVSILEVTGTPAFNPRWQMIDTTGTLVGGPNSGRGDAGPVPEAGTYWFEVYDIGSDGDGEYKLHVQRLTYPYSCEGIPLPCDSTITAAISEPNENDLLSFDVSDTEMVYISVAEVSGTDFNAGWRVIDASGAVVGSSVNGIRGTRGPYAGDGSPYRVHVFEWDHDATGVYQVHLERLTAGSVCDPVPLPCDSVVSGSLDTEIDSELFAFDVTDSEIVYVGVLEESGAGFNAGWRVLDASGAEVWGGDPGTRGTRGPYGASGSPYSVHVFEWEGDATGTFGVHLQRLTDSAACEGTPLVCDGLVTGSLVHPLDNDLFTFTVADTEVVYLSVLEESGVDFNVGWRVLDALGNQVWGGDSGVRGDRGPFDASGSPYQVHVYEWEADATGTYRIHLQRLDAGEACEAPTLVCDSTVTAAIDDEIDNDLFEFAVTGEEWVYVSVLEQAGTPGFNLDWRILDADGTQVWGWDSAVRGDRGPFAANGSPYRVQVAESSHDATGVYEVHLQRITSAFACETIPFSCDTTLTRTIDSPIDNDLLSFSVSDTERLHVAVTEEFGTTGFDLTWRVLDGAGNQVRGWDGSTRADAGPYTAAEGPYRIQVAENGANATGTYQANLQRLTVPYTCEAIPLPSAIAWVDTIDSGIDTDLFEVVFPAEYPVAAEFALPITVSALSMARAPLDPSWRVLDATGQEPCGGWRTGSFTCVLDSATDPMPYQVQVRSASASGTGTYEIVTAMYGATGVETPPRQVPTAFALDQNVPNPFGGRTSIEFALPRRGSVLLRVFDVRGHVVAELVNEELDAGFHRVPWDARRVAGGIYFYRLETEGYARARKMMLVR